MNAEKTKGTQKTGKNTKELDLSSQDALILSLLDQHRRLSSDIKNGLTKPQQKVVLAGMFIIISDQNRRLKDLNEVVDLASKTITLLSDRLKDLNNA